MLHLEELCLSVVDGGFCLGCAAEFFLPFQHFLFFPHPDHLLRGLTDDLLWRYDLLWVNNFLWGIGRRLSNFPRGIGRNYYLFWSLWRYYYLLWFLVDWGRIILNRTLHHGTLTLECVSHGEVGLLHHIGLLEYDWIWFGLLGFNGLFGVMSVVSLPSIDHKLLHRLLDEGSIKYLPDDGSIGGRFGEEFPKT
jgi:hypothetical protein